MRYFTPPSNRLTDEELSKLEITVGVLQQKSGGDDSGQNFYFRILGRNMVPYRLEEQMLIDFYQEIPRHGLSMYKGVKVPFAYEGTKPRAIALPELPLAIETVS